MGTVSKTTPSYKLLIFSSKRLKSKIIDSAFGPEVEGRYANLCQDLDRKNHHLGGRSLRYHRERQGQNPGQGRNPSGSATFDLRRKTIGRWPNLERLQYSKRVDSAFGPEVEGRYANLRQDLDRKNHYFGGRSLRHHRERQGQDSGQGRDSSGSTTFDLCRKTIGRWPNLVRLQYSKRVNSSSCTSFERWILNNKIYLNFQK